MDPSVGLQAASGLVSFLLKSTLEWGVCLLLVRIAGSAKMRFNLLLAMVLGFLAQWLCVAAGIVRTATGPRVSPVWGPMTKAAPAERIPVAAHDVGILSQVMLALLVVYAAGLAWKLLSAIAIRMRLAGAMRRKVAPSSRMEEVFQGIAAQVGIDDCNLWVLHGLSSPATVGWLRPQVIVPPACEGQDEAELEAVFWHELKHVERRDALWNAAIRMCRSVLWFHPAVYQAVKALHAQRELACDAAVVEEHPYSRDVYATCLLRFARVGDLVSTIEMASSAELLKTRVRTILSDAPVSSRWMRMCRATANISLLGVMAATVPALNILFAAPLHLPVSPVAMEAVTAAHFHLKPKTRTLRSGLTQRSETQAMPSTAGTDASVPLRPVAHDEALAAEHRAAAGILTESSGMEQSAENPASYTQAADRGGRGVAPAAPSTWGSVALNAAEKMVPLMGEHDGDHH